ncbi:hypothetical protein JR316_0005544 [Psilocybe cubensis]|uniref:Uncharacterized protein n=2 Tax=Psilocybe cubensis TaxID=181762 RepID=A0ACB8H1F0_PSICU|nr:hypothetical protein JR316_0005544 [Psilocybe cubensis]KAH9481025.1 hypothetical protein JR316_0005544 [Psilocybe cubensis]
MSQSNIFNFSNIALYHNGSGATSITDGYREPPNGFHGFEGGIDDFLLPSNFQEYYMPEQDTREVNSIPQTHGGNDDLQEGLLGLENATMDVVHHSAAHAVPSAGLYTSQDLAQIWDSNFSSLNDSLVDPVEHNSSAAFYSRPAAMPMSSSFTEVPNPVYSDYAHYAYGEPSGSHSGSTSRNAWAQTPIDTFLMDHQTGIGAIPASITPSPQDLSVGPSRQLRDMSHHMYTPHRLVVNQHDISAHRRESAPHLQPNSTWRIPRSGEMSNQNMVSENGQFQGVKGSGVIPVEQTSKEVTESHNPRRSKPQQQRRNGSQRAPRDRKRSAKRGEKPFIPVIRGAWDIAVGESGTR